MPVAAPFLVAALLAVLAFLPAARAEEPAGPVSPQVGPAPALPPSPFGPGYDPLRDPPTEPKETGAGITAATVVASGHVEIEEFTKAGQQLLPTFAAVLEVTVAAGSTTPPLAMSSVRARGEKGEPVPLVALCLPGAEDETLLWRPLDAALAHWHILLDGKTWDCGGRTVRMVTRLRTGGARLVNQSAKEWKGPLLLIFQTAERPTEITLPGRTVTLPAPPVADEPAG